MLQRTIPTGQVLALNSLSFESAGNAVWAVTSAGDVVTVRLLDERVDVLGSGYLDPVAVVPLADGLRVAVAEATGALWLTRRDAADRAQARALASVPGGAIAAHRHPDPNLLLVLAAGSLDGDPTPQLVTCSLETGDLTVVSSDLEGARTFVVDPALRQAAVLSVLADGSRALRLVDLDSGSGSSVTGLPPYDHLTTSPDPAQPGVLATRADQTAGQLVLVTDSGAEVATEDVGAPIDGLTRWGSLVLVASGPDLVALEWNLDEGALPLTAPLGPLYVSGYARLLADLSAAGLVAGDVAYEVREGVEGGSISVGLEPANPDGTESVMLLAGVRSGEYHLDARLVADGTLLSARRFRVTSLWPDEEVGPPIAITGDHQNYLMRWGGTGGGGSYLHPAPDLWRVLVVLVFVRDRGWDGFEVAARQEWKDRVVGPGESARRYYEEVSAFQPGNHGMTVELVGNQVFGPVFVDAGWGDVFDPKKATDVNAGWKTKPTGYAALAGAISGFFVDLPGEAGFMQLADSISIVVRSGSDSPTDMGPIAPKLPTRYVWGHASSTDFFRKTATTYTQGKKPVVVMTEAYPPEVGPKNLTYTLCHEIGHNLGLADLYDAKGDYPAEINARRTAADLMSATEGLPHFSVANRIRLGWIKRAWLRTFDFSANPNGDSWCCRRPRRSGAAVPPTAGWPASRC